MKRNVFPHSFTGALSVVLALLTVAAFLYACLSLIRSLPGSGFIGPQLGVWLGTVMVLVPAAPTILTVLLARKLRLLHDGSWLVLCALWVGIILAAGAYPVLWLIVYLYEHQLPLFYGCTFPNLFLL